MSKKPCYILGIESSCDETSAAVLKDDRVLSNIIANQEIHKKFNGVVPELASREHQKNIIPVVIEALNKANIEKKDINAVAYTFGPGLLGSLLVGSSFAKSLSIGLKIPIIAVNHMQAHLLCHFIDQNIEKPDFPFIGVTLSGGHTQIIIVKNFFDMKLIGSTLDDAIGEAYDKCGRLMGLDYPSGPLIDKLSKNGDNSRFKFPLPKVDGLNVSYSGVKTSFLNFLSKKSKPFIEENLVDLCASIQSTLNKIIINKIVLATQKFNIKTVVIGGGVACNSNLRNELLNLSIEKEIKVHLPIKEYTTDNGAMIGIVGYLKFKEKIFSTISQEVKSKLTF